MNFKRLVSIFITLIFMISCMSIQCVFAAEPWEGMLETNVLSNLSSVDNTGEDGLFHSMQEKNLLSGSYARITYSVSGTYSDDTVVFILKPFDNQWGGWDDNPVTIGASVKESDGEYIAYVSLADVKASLSSGGTLFGINFYFNKGADYATVIKDLSILSAQSLEPVITANDYLVTDTSVTVSNAGSSAALIVALYKNGKLITAKPYTGSNTITANYASDMASALASATDIKAFVWNNTASITPRGAGFEAPLSSLVSGDRGNLNRSIAYCENMDSSKYQTSSWQTFIAAVETAKKTASNASATDAQCKTARQTLEDAKSKLLFVNSTDSGNPQPFRDMSNSDIVYEMGVGWNLGNTMEGHAGFHPSETSWQSIITTKEIIKSVHDAGINTIRVPVTWGDMIDDENGYAIDDAWMSRVQDVVDYCTELDMYTIINIHHDGAEQDGWLRVAADDIDSVFEKYENVWRHIANKFRDYDEHLIFESANELTCMEGGDKNSTAAKNYDIPVIMNLNQIFVNTVRATGSNNTKRWLGCVSHYANAGTDSAFKMPSDSYNSSPKLMFGAHIYKHTTKAEWTYAQVYEVVDQLKKMNSKFKSYPMYLGEYGNRNYVKSGSATGYNDIQRAQYNEIVHMACQVAKVVPCVWDQGWFDDTQTAKGDGSWTVWDRAGLKPRYKSITDAMMRGIYLTPSSSNKSYNMNDIALNPTVTAITSITPSQTEVSGEIGGKVTLSAAAAPSGTNDVVLWKSANDEIATVSRGIIQFNKIGTTTVTAFSQSGSASADITVTVLPKAGSKPAVSIKTDSESYTVLKGKYVNITAAAEPADTDAYLTYTSTNPEVATVNRFGKIVGISAGSAYITITASNGITKTVPVRVNESKSENKLNLAVNVYYNDSKYSKNEVGQQITVTEDGQYTLSFDTASDLSSAAKSAGIKYLKNLTAIYIKDNDVTNGLATKSPIDGCEIRYDSVKVNGTELTITKGDFKSALKDNGQFDTNDPINGWDGSAVAEASADKNHVANFTSIDNPTKIEITFTLKNLAFKQEIPKDVIPAAELKVQGDAAVTLAAGASGTLAVTAAPVNTTSYVSFISSDKSVIMIDETGKKPDSGAFSAAFKAVGEGTATVTAIADSGVKTVFTITVE